jgi:hypothetical protein
LTLLLSHLLLRGVHRSASREAKTGSGEERERKGGRVFKKAMGEEGGKRPKPTRNGCPFLKAPMYNGNAGRKAYVFPAAAGLRRGPEGGGAPGKRKSRRWAPGRGGHAPQRETRSRAANSTTASRASYFRLPLLHREKPSGHVPLDEDQNLSFEDKCAPKLDLGSAPRAQRRLPERVRKRREELPENNKNEGLEKEPVWGPSDGGRRRAAQSASTTPASGARLAEQGRTHAPPPS